MKGFLCGFAPLRETKIEAGEALIKDGIKRVVNGLRDDDARQDTKA